MPKKQKPTIEQMKRMEEYLKCTCVICDHVAMLHDILNALKLAAMVMPLKLDTEDMQEIAELQGAAQKLIDFHVVGHLLEDFNLTIEVAQSINDYKNEMARREMEDDDIPF